MRCNFLLRVVTNALLITTKAVSASETPLWNFRPCSIYQRDDCWGRTAETLRPNLVAGIHQLNLPPIDPMHIPSYRTSRRNSNVATYDANLIDVVWTGAKDFEIVESELDAKVLVARLKIRYPKISFEGDEEVDGTILGFPVAGRLRLEVDFGDSFILANLTTDIVLNGDEFAVNGETHVRWRKEEVTIAYDDVRFTVHDLFADVALLKLFNVVINNSLRIIDPITRSLVDNMLVASIIQYINLFHRSFPKNTLYM